MYDSVKVFKVKRRLWGNQLKLYNLVHFPHLTFLGTVFLSVFKNIPSPSVFAYRIARRTIPGFPNYGTKIFGVCFTFKGRH
jgi:hypothetical protein